VRAWNIYNGSLAPQAAGAIHTDFEKGFIKARRRRGNLYCSSSDSLLVRF